MKRKGLLSIVVHGTLALLFIAAASNALAEKDGALDPPVNEEVISSMINAAGEPAETDLTDPDGNVTAHVTIYPVKPGGNAARLATEFRKATRFILSPEKGDMLATESTIPPSFTIYDEGRSAVYEIQPAAPSSPSVCVKWKASLISKTSIKKNKKISIVYNLTNAPNLFSASTSPARSSNANPDIFIYDSYTKNLVDGSINSNGMDTVTFVSPDCSARNVTLVIRGESPGNIGYSVTNFQVR